MVLEGLQRYVVTRPGTPYRQNKVKMVAAAEVKAWGMRVVTSGLSREVYDVRSSGLLRSVEWQFLTDVSGQPVGPDR
jgi:hypothetical protein